MMALPLNAFHTLDTEFNKTITWKQTVNVNGGKIRETFQRGAHVNSIDNHAMGNWNKSFYTVDNSICNCTKKKNTAIPCFISISTVLWTKNCF